MDETNGTPIEELDDNVMNEIEDILNEDEEDVPVKQTKSVSKKSNMSPLFYKKLKSVSFDTFIIVVLVLVASNKYLLNSLFKLPFLVKFESSAFAPSVVLALIISILFFGIKMML